MKIGDISFLIIGAAKSATTWLQESLMADPAVSMPEPEIHYFSRKYQRGSDWYLAQFPRVNGEVLVGEKSNTYLDHPAAAGRIRAVLPHAKLIAQLRNPVDRAYSDYCMLYRRGEIGGDIDRYLDPRTGAETRFLQGGLYRGQLQRYFDLYPREKVLVLLYDDLGSSPAAQLDRVRSFLGLGRTEIAPAPKGRVKDRGSPVINPSLRRYLAPAKSMVKPFRGTRIIEAAYRAVAWKPTYPPMSSDLRKRLVAYYEKETGLLGELLGLDLSTWMNDDHEIAPAESKALAEVTGRLDEAAR